MVSASAVILLGTAPSLAPSVALSLGGASLSIKDSVVASDDVVEVPVKIKKMKKGRFLTNLR